MLGTLHVIKNSCFTHTDFSSCSINMNASRESKIRTLVSDLAAGERRLVGCEAVSINAKGKAQTDVWRISVIGKREYGMLLLFVRALNNRV